MFSLRDLRFVLCSRDLDVLRAQRIIGFFISITHKSTRSESVSPSKVNSGFISSEVDQGLLSAVDSELQLTLER